jgi:DNA-directed RNA polymerase specialized sigma24 family protein
MERRARWQALLEKGLAEEIVARREELKPELENRLRHLDACLAQLPEHKWLLVEGYYYKRDSIETLAGASGRTADATYKALQRIRRSLQLCIERAVGLEGAG